jgi:hypothetical protein
VCDRNDGSRIEDSTYTVLARSLISLDFVVLKRVRRRRPWKVTTVLEEISLQARYGHPMRAGVRK